MNICIVTDEYHTESYWAGGIAQQNGKIARFLCRGGHKVMVLVPGREDLIFEESPGLTVILFKPRRYMHWRIRSIVNRHIPGGYGRRSFNRVPRCHDAARDCGSGGRL